MLEKKNNYYVKELDNVERYLLRIIKRYFDIEELNNKNTINAIIAEAMTRYKSSIIYERRGVDALNDKAGIVNVNIRSFNGEKSFDKGTAFNKDFGTDADTICEGNDYRLSNKREPTAHNHLIKNINELREQLDALKKEITGYSNHLHKNLQLLEKIIYTGDREQIDLLEVEQLLSVIAPLLQLLNIRKVELKNTYDNYKDGVEDAIAEFENIKKYMRYLDTELEKVLKKYTNDKILELNTIKENINPKPKKELFDNIKSIANNNMLYAFTQYVSISYAGSSAPQETIIDYDLMDETYNRNTVEMQAELLYNSNTIKLPYITKEFVINAGITGDNLYIQVQPLVKDVVLPNEVVNGKVKCDFYAQRNLL